jgi:hypothetical protein
MSQIARRVERFPFGPSARPRYSACATAAITAWSRPTTGEPDFADPTGVLAVTFGDLASPLIADGVLRYYLLHTALPCLPEALSNLGFGRNGAYGFQTAAPRRRSSAVAVRVAGVEHLGAVARLAPVEVLIASVTAGLP